MKLKMVPAVGVAAVAAVAVGLGVSIGYRIHKDSPIEVGDGSIHASVGTFNRNKWIRLIQGTLYTAKSTNNDCIRLAGFTDHVSHAFAPSLLQRTGGWLIVISSKNPDNQTIRPNTISLCSNISPTPSACLGTSLAEDNMVYIQANRTNRWEEELYFWKARLNFHDTRYLCDAYTDAESDCDHISRITIATVNKIAGANGNTYDCAVQDDCTITVGTPSP